MKVDSLGIQVPSEKVCGSLAIGGFQDPISYHLARRLQGCLIGAASAQCVDSAPCVIHAQDVAEAGVP